MKKISILGSTGSIGSSTLAVVRENRHLFSVEALVAANNSDLLLEQCREFQPSYVALVSPTAADHLANALKSESIKTEVLVGIEAISQLASLSNVELVVSAIVGAAGLLPTLQAIRAGKTILLANKESLVTCGHIFMRELAFSEAKILPIDSEHNAIFQSLPAVLQQNLGQARLADFGVSKILLTGSGGPLKNYPLGQLANVTPEIACNHPNWSMGRKISVDSATMMNKGLEYIEARWLFNAKPTELEIVIHPQSIIHSMVCYIDGSILAQLGSPDMCTPIAYAMGYPNRITSSVPTLDFHKIGALTFEKPDFQRYPCLKLAIDAFNTGQVKTTALNAANEIAVAAFLEHRIQFNEIFSTNAHVLERVSYDEPDSVEGILEIDNHARQIAQEYIKTKI